MSERVPDPALCERIRRAIARVPLRVTREGITRLDFDAYRRGECRNREGGER